MSAETNHHESACALRRTFDANTERQVAIMRKLYEEGESQRAWIARLFQSFPFWKKTLDGNAEK
jgi:hypothetical protein